MTATDIDTSTKITTLLVANRGEIARRVIRTAKAMGIRTVAVYSDPDVSSPHVADADVAVALHGAASSDSYLCGDKILNAARRTGSDAIHPGYGFLSENPDFASACAAAGVTFVGPSPESMRDMALKDRAKEIARKAGVPVLADAAIEDDETATWLAAADAVGYPLLVKAVAGGGGKGMRLVDGPQDVTDAVTGARREAGGSFGNPAVFLERYLPSARHIEIQVFGDHHGNAVHFGERECSVQRRHQKVLEEAPSPVLAAGARAEMGATAVALVRELAYVGAGTVEYLYDDVTGEFFFLEMNTRLQVEHPVTEEVYGVDLVALQLRVARGEPLNIDQRTVEPHGHAIEVRLYAEDPARNFLPTPGVLHHYSHPEAPGLRYEDGVSTPGEVSAFYDPMLAKIIAHATNRSEAAMSLARALDLTRVHGITTNRQFLAALLRDSDFLEGRTTTDFLDRHPELCTPAPATPPAAHLAAAVACAAARHRRDDRLAPPGFRSLNAELLTTAEWQQAGHEATEVRYRIGAARGDTDMVLEYDGHRHELTLTSLTPESVVVGLDGVDYPCTTRVYADGSVWVEDSAGQSEWHVEPRLPDSANTGTAAGPVSEMPGTVVAVLVEPGQRVSAGQRLVVVESMKMEHPAEATNDGVVEAVHVSIGQFVEAHTVLVSMAQEEAS